MKGGFDVRNWNGNQHLIKERYESTIMLGVQAYPIFLMVFHLAALEKDSTLLNEFRDALQRLINARLSGIIAMGILCRGLSHRHDTVQI
jgi:hypothetical protein